MQLEGLAVAAYRSYDGGLPLLPTDIPDARSAAPAIANKTEQLSEIAGVAASDTASYALTFRGWWDAPVTGSVTFQLAADGAAAQLYLDGALMFTNDASVGYPGAPNTATVTSLSAGRHFIEASSASCRLDFAGNTT